MIQPGPDDRRASPEPLDRRAFLASAAAMAGGVALGRGSLAAEAGVRTGGGPARLAGGPDGRGMGQAGRPLPSLAQLTWQQDELALFLHFGVNTFTDREWGDGTEDPAVFDPSALDTRQWARVAREAGFRAMVLTAKHHDGFCLWPSATTDHSVAASPWRGGRGDVVREFVDACRAEGLRVGLYCSPWDRNHPTYGDSPRYNDVYVTQLTELLTRYGPVHEVWFDGANGEGPNGKRQEYDWPRFWGLVRRLQPDAVMFSDAGPDVRWIGNEAGVAGDPNWSTVDPAVVPVPGMAGPDVVRQLQHGDREGTVWRPGETDVSIRPGWFYHAAEDGRVRTPDDLVDLYFTSVGRNSKLLLNVPPTPAGRLHDADVAAVRGMRRRLDRLFADDLTGGRPLRWTLSDGTTAAGDPRAGAHPAEDSTAADRRGTPARRAVGTLQLGRPVVVGVSDLGEDIAAGQRVERWKLEGREAGAWRVLAAGETIGYRKLDRFRPTRIDAIRLTVRTLARPRPVRVGLTASQRNDSPTGIT